MAQNYYDVLVVGAGLSGICAGYYLQTKCPDKTYAILEGREAMGGTWDLFRYPGIRSDSDMYTLGYTFHPWREPQAIAEGKSILDYIHETASSYNINEKIRYQHRVCSASWSSDDNLWTVDVQQADGTIQQFTCNFLLMCTGYYDYENGYSPDFIGSDDFKGDIIHPQQWDESINYEGKRVVVIGSGATAVTLVPAMAEKTEHITMLQRSPTYIVSSPTENAFANWLNKYLPEKLAYKITRWRIILTSIWTYQMTRHKPDLIKDFILDGVHSELGDDFDIEKHFTPDYNPWDQRICLVPDSDLFNVLKDGSASIVTDHIDCFTEDGILLKSGEFLPAELVITATGLRMKLMKGIQLHVDGEQVNLGDVISYKGAMYSNIPNLAMTFGYTNASWTLKCELICDYVCRLLNHMEQHNFDKCVPQLAESPEETIPFSNFSSGYFKRAYDSLPKQATNAPWQIYQNYLLDIMAFRFSSLNDGAMTFS